MKPFYLALYLVIVFCDIIAVSGEESPFSGNLIRRESWNGPIKGSVSYTYDNDLDITSRRLNELIPISYDYDADKLLRRAGDLAITRNTQNALIKSTTLRGISDSRNYNEFGELTNYNVVFGTTTLYSEQLTRDALGRSIAKMETISGTTSQFTYAYDPAGRLATVTLNGDVIATYSYDSNGNRLTAGNGGESRNGAYDQQDRLLTAGPIAYTYNANGELATRTVPNQADTTYEYDLLGNLIRVLLPNGRNIRYLIDGLNRRVGKTVNGTLAEGFLYDRQRRLIAQLDGSGNVANEFVYGTLDHSPDYMIKSGETYRIISDHLGSPRLVVNIASGAIAQRLDFDSFGHVLTDSAPGFQPFGFAGGLYDRDTSLVRFGARDYDGEAGRWTAKDPIRFGGGQLNLYAYVANDPVNQIDPTGLQTAGPQCLPGPPLKRDPKLDKLLKQLKKQEERANKQRKNKPPEYYEDEDDEKWLQLLQIQR